MARRRWLRPLVWTLVIIGLAVVTVTLAIPLVLRGPALARFVEWQTAGLCGTIRIAGGEIGTALVPNVLLGRPTTVELDLVQVLAADGAPVFDADRLSAAVKVHLRPWRIEVRDLRLRSARVNVVERAGPRRAGLASVFRRLPANGDREGCFSSARARRVAGQSAPRPPSPPQLPLSPRNGRVPVEVSLHDATLEDVDLVLDFPLWSLALKGISASGKLELASGEGGASPRFSFAVAPLAAAKGGTLRVGSARNPLAAEVPFDAVRITRFSSGDAAGPADLVLEVEQATTGRSVLAGRARFTDVMAVGRGPRLPGLDLDARWTQLGDGIREIERRWGIPERYRGRLDGSASAVLKGPFNALAGKVHFDGRRVDLDLALAADRRVDAAIRIDELDTAAMLDRSMVPLLGGRLAGQVRVHSQLGARPARMSIFLDEARLRLDRARAGPWPKRWRLRMGRSALSDPGQDRTERNGDLDLVLSGARLDRGTLLLDGIRAVLEGAEVRIAGSAAVLDERTGEPLRQPRIDARVEAQGMDFARLLPALPLRGRLAFQGTLRGRSGALAMNARFPAGSVVRAWGQPFALPSQADARVVDGERLIVPTLRLTHEGGGALEVGGSVVFDGPIDAHVAVKQYSLANLPAVERLGVSVAGLLDSRLTVTGSALRPRLAGQLGLSGVRVDGVSLGGGAVSFSPEGQGVRVEGRLVDAVAVRGRLALGVQPSADGTVTIRDLPLGPFLARVAPGLAARLSADAAFEIGAGGTFQLDATLGSLDASYQLPRRDLKIVLRNEAPGRIKATERGAILEPLRLRGDGVEVIAKGQADRADVRGELRATVALAPFRAAFGSALKEATGMVEVVLSAQGPRSAPARRAELRVIDPLRIWPTTLLLPVTVPRGVVAIQGTRLEATALSVAIGGAELRLDGGAQVDAEDWRRTVLDLNVTGQFDPAILARRLPQFLPEAHGRAQLAGRVAGTLGTPMLHGHADLHGIGGRLKDAPIDIQAINGRIEINGQTLTTSSLAVTLAPTGQLQVGGLAAAVGPRGSGSGGPAGAGPALAGPPVPGATTASMTSPPPAAPAIAMLELPTTARPALGRVSIPISGRDIGGRVPVGGVLLKDLDLDLSLVHEPGGPLRIVGDVWVRSASFAPTEARVPSNLLGPLRRRVGARAGRRVIFPEVYLDIGVHAKRGGLDVRVPYLPDFAVAFDCRLTGSPRAPRLTGSARGSSLYSRLALFLFDSVTDNNVRSCGARPPR